METMMADDELCDFNLTAQHGTHSVRVHRAVVAAAAPKQAAGRTCECEQASLGREATTCTAPPFTGEGHL